MKNNHITIRDVALRDGLQSIKSIVSLEHKQQWIDLAYAAGLRHLEVGSFVPAKLMPQLADTAQVVSYAKQTYPELQVTVLAPNLRGVSDAMASGADEVLIPVSASHAHSLANVRKTPAEMVAMIAEAVALKKQTGSAIEIEVGLSTAFGCTIQGEVPHKDVLNLCEQLLSVGVKSIGLADTVGFAGPGAVTKLFNATRQAFGDVVNTGHFHDTRGMGVVNSYAAVMAGATRLDASVAGIGGCPHAPGASGNVNTEDVIFMLHEAGFETGIDLPKLMALHGAIKGWIPAERTQGALFNAKLPKVLEASL